MNKKIYSLENLIKLKEQSNIYKIQEQAQPSKQTNIFQQLFTHKAIGELRGTEEKNFYLTDIDLNTVSKINPELSKQINQRLTIENINNLRKEWIQAVKPKKFFNLSLNTIKRDKDKPTITLGFKPRAKKKGKNAFAEALPLIERIFSKYLQFAVTKDILDDYFKTIQNNKNWYYTPPTVAQMQGFNKRFFTPKRIESYLNKGYEVSMPILYSSLRECLESYGQILTEDYLKFYDIFNEEELEKIKGFNDLIYLTEEFLIKYLTKAYKTLGHYIKNNYTELARRFTDKLLGGGQGKESFIAKIKENLNTLAGFTNMLVNKNAQENNNQFFFKKYLDTIQKNIDVYTKKVQSPFTLRQKAALQ